MRIARSVSPCLRKSEPSAKWRSIVCGSTLTTSMNDSIALSGCSFSRKLRPRKYDSGSARDSCRRCLMSMRAAIQPSAKNSAGIGRSHHSSKSMRRSEPGGRRLEPGTRRGRRARGRPACRWQRGLRAMMLAAQPRKLPLQPHHLDGAREQAEGDPGRERKQDHEHERRLPRIHREQAQRDGVGVLQRDEQQRDEYERDEDPAQEAHLGRAAKRKAARESIVAACKRLIKEANPARG